MRISSCWWGCPPALAYYTGFHKLLQLNFRIFVEFALKSTVIPHKQLKINKFCTALLQFPEIRELEFSAPRAVRRRRRSLKRARCQYREAGRFDNAGAARGQAMESASRQRRNADMPAFRRPRHRCKARRRATNAVAGDCIRDILR